MKVMFALDVPEEHSYIVMVRRVARALLEHHLVDAENINDVETVLGELCSNVTRHARSEAGCYRVTLEHHQDHQHQDYLVLVVADQGSGFDPSQVPPVGEPREDVDGMPRYGGFGLHLVQTLADHVEIKPSQPKGTTVRTEKRLVRSSQVADSV